MPAPMHNQPRPPFDVLVFESVEPDLGWPCFFGECLRCGYVTLNGYIIADDVLRVLENHRALCSGRPSAPSGMHG